MAQISTHERPKTLAEGAVCFACTAAILFAAALATQWLFSLV